ALPRWVFTPFPKQIKGQDGKYGQGDIGRYQHSVTKQIRAKRVQRDRKNTGRTPKQIACPHERDCGSKGREKNHCSTRPEENAIRVISIKKSEGECIFDAGCPIWFGLVES